VQLRTILNRWTACLIPTIFCLQTAHSAPIAGMWKKQFIAQMYVPAQKTYKPWDFPSPAECLSDEALAKLPIFSPSNFLHNKPQIMGDCVVTGSVSSSAWSMACKSQNATFEITATISDTEIVGIIHTSGMNGAEGPEIETRYRRVGDCAKP